MNSNFRAFWLAPVTRNILGYSLFCDRIQNGFSFRDSSERWNFSGKWSSCANKYQERDKIWLLGVYWSVGEKFLTEFATVIKKKWSRKPCQLKRKQTVTKWPLLLRKSSFLIFIQLIWKILRPRSPSGSVHSANISTTIHLPFGG